MQSKPAVLPLYSEELSFVSEISLCKVVNIGHELKSGLSFYCPRDINSKSILLQLKRGKAATCDKSFLFEPLIISLFLID
jgi:hypothetical protein